MHLFEVNTDILGVIVESLGVSQAEIKDIEILKKGLTNCSFLFSCRNKKYIMRIPGIGTDQFINRKAEAQVYQVIGAKRIADEIVYFNPNNGYKISRFFDNARVCNPKKQEDLVLCMRKLREFHDLKLKVQHTFDIFERIEFYEKLRKGIPSQYKDYEQTKRHVLELKDYINQKKQDFVLAHMDAVHDNFIFVGEGEHNFNKMIRLIDWEYAGMQDAHVDIAMFCIYALFSREQIDNLIDIYFENKCDFETKIKIYCYISVGGLLWSNWCEYKNSLGVEMGEYSKYQYNYAKKYYQIVKEELGI